MRIILPLIVLVIVAVIGLQWLEEYVYDKLWTREKILPLYAKVSAMDPESREYLDESIVEGLRTGKLTIDDAIELQKKHQAT